MNILQEIFNDNYEIIQYTLHPRAVEMENIEKMMNCGDPSFGGAMYACSQCGKMKFVPFRCKSRFCPTCGVKYCQERSTSMSFKLLRCGHRHCVFTIDEELRHFFLEDRSLLDCLFQAVRNVVSQMFYKLNKSERLLCLCKTFPFRRQYRHQIYQPLLGAPCHRPFPHRLLRWGKRHFPL